MEFDPESAPWADAYRLLIGAVVPRPIAWVATRSTDGVNNLAPFSFFNAVCANPMIVTFAPGSFASGGTKDTLANIEATGEFVINAVTEALLERMDATAAEVPPDVDEFAAAGIATAPSRRVAPARVAESPIALECARETVLRFGSGPGGGALVVGRVIHVFVADDVLVDGRIDVSRFRPVARMGGKAYARPDVLPFVRRSAAGAR